MHDVGWDGMSEDILRYYGSSGLLYIVCIAVIIDSNLLYTL
jgi:hypothetical protein